MNSSRAWLATRICRDKRQEMRNTHRLLAASCLLSSVLFIWVTEISSGARFESCISSDDRTLGVRPNPPGTICKRDQVEALVILPAVVSCADS